MQRLVTVISIIVIAFALLTFLNARSRKLNAKSGRQEDDDDDPSSDSGSAFIPERDWENPGNTLEEFPIRTLSPEESDSFARDWRHIQHRFADDAPGAVAEADKLAQSALRTCGYPTAREFEEQAADLAPEHPGIVENYRAAHEIAERDADEAASTEDLRAAMNHYRALFEDLFGRRVDGPAAERARNPRRQR